MERKQAVVVIHHGADLTGAQGARPIQKQLFGHLPMVSIVPKGTDRPIASDWVLQSDNVGEALAEVMAFPEFEQADIVHVLTADAVVGKAWHAVASYAVGNPMLPWIAVGPCGESLTGGQHVRVPDEVLAKGYGACSNYIENETQAASFGTADALDACAIAFRGEALREVPFMPIADVHRCLRQWFADAALAGHPPVVVARGTYGTRLRRDPRPWPPAEHDASVIASLTHVTEQRVGAIVAPLPTNRRQLILLRYTLRMLSARDDLDHVTVAVFGPLTGFFEGEAPPKALAGCTDENSKPFEQWAKRPFKESGIKVRVKCHPSAPPPNKAEEYLTQLAREAEMDWALLVREGEVIDAPSGELKRLARHPNLGVRAYNVATVTRALQAASTVEYVRQDTPFGDGGSLSGDAPGSNAARMWRTIYSSRHASGGLRLASVTAINRGFGELTDFHAQVARDGVSIRQHQRPNLGAFMLTYGGDSLADVERWLDWLYGLVSSFVIVWTGEESIPTSLLQVFELYASDGWHLIERPLREDFAAARNAAVERLEADGAEHIMFVDPDEWVDDPAAALMPYRRAAQTTDPVAFSVRAENFRPDGRRGLSHGFRIWSTAHGLRFRGAVHESIQDDIVDGGHRDAVRLLPTTIYNLGSFEDEGKSERYASILLTYLSEHPNSSRHWLSLAWWYRDQGHHDKELQCLRRSVETASNTAFMPSFELARYLLREVRSLLVRAGERVDDTRPESQAALRLVRAIDENVPVAKETAPISGVPGLPAHEEE